ncbi:tetratricopeptide repeat protein [Aeoliella sp.]|uniref:tetratricopeptide repeat protein n=1 Tax=Aeoliella sp. TaxID=2795800 RepID=UPI003CCC2076
MRKVLIATLIATTGSFATAAPYFNSSTTPTPPKQESSGWHLPKFWGKKEVAPEPQFMYQAPAPQPSTTQRITSALVDNRAVAAARGWMSSEGEAEAPKPNPISLSTPTGPPTPSLMVAMAQVQEQQGDVEGARQVYMKALAAGPKNVKTLRELGHFEDRQNRLADAERYYAEAAKIDPQNPAVLNDLALCLARQNKLAPSAQLLDQAIALEPAKPLYRNNMATVLMEIGDQHRAMSHLMSVHPPAAAYYNMGHLLEKGGQNEAAAAHYAEALRLNPNLKAAATALAKIAPPSQTEVPQTAMAPAASQPAAATQEAWPSEPLPNSTVKPAANEPQFGPRLLP